MNEPSTKTVQSLRKVGGRACGARSSGTSRSSRSCGPRSSGSRSSAWARCLGRVPPLQIRGYALASVEWLLEIISHVLPSVRGTSENVARRPSSIAGLPGMMERARASAEGLCETAEPQEASPARGTSAEPDHCGDARPMTRAFPRRAHETWTDTRSTPPPLVPTVAPSQVPHHASRPKAAPLATSPGDPSDGGGAIVASPAAGQRRKRPNRRHCPGPISPEWRDSRLPPASSRPWPSRAPQTGPCAPRCAATQAACASAPARASGASSGHRGPGAGPPSGGSWSRPAR